MLLAATEYCRVLPCFTADHRVLERTTVYYSALQREYYRVLQRPTVVVSTESYRLTNSCRLLQSALLLVTTAGCSALQQATAIYSGLQGNAVYYSAPQREYYRELQSFAVP